MVDLLDGDKFYGWDLSPSESEDEEWRPSSRISSQADAPKADLPLESPGVSQQAEIFLGIRPSEPQMPQYV